MKKLAATRDMNKESSSIASCFITFIEKYIIEDYGFDGRDDNGRDEFGKSERSGISKARLPWNSDCGASGNLSPFTGITAIRLDS